MALVACSAHSAAGGSPSEKSSADTTVVNLTSDTASVLCHADLDAPLNILAKLGRVRGVQKHIIAVHNGDLLGLRKFQHEDPQLKGRDTRTG